jgi:DNA repair protein RadD
MNPRIWNRISYNISSGELLRRGYLSPLKYYPRTLVDHKDIPLNKSRSDFDLEAYTQLILPNEEIILASINGARKHRKAVLVFCSSVEQAKRFATAMTKAEVVTGTTPAKERDRILKDFASGEIQVLFNVSCLTVGYDYPALDTIYMLRPTRSLRLYMQMLGRGVRIAEGKEDCFVIDYSGNFKNLGRIEDIELKKEKLWELYANGRRLHGQEIFSWGL